MNFESPYRDGLASMLRVQAGTESAILLNEKSMDSTATLLAHLERATGWRVLHAESPSVGLRYASTLRSTLKVAIVTTGRDFSQAQNFVRQLKNASAAKGIECPRFMALSLLSQGPEVAVAFEKLGAHYLLRAYSEQIVEVVKKIQWQCRMEKHLPTIILRRCGGHVAQISVKTGCAEVQIQAGPKLRELAEYLMLHSRTEHTTEMLADALGVCRQSVKEYLLRLRRAFNRARAGTCVGASGEQVFWTRKVSGGYVHGISANVEIEDSDEFMNLAIPRYLPHRLAQPLVSRMR